MNLIIGGGIGGPVVAMALQRAGLEAVVYEARAQPADDEGAFLNTASNALAALATLGIDPRLLHEGFPTPRMVMLSGSGKRLGEVANGVQPPDGPVSVTIKRGLLHRALRDEAVRRGVRIETGKRLVNATERDEGVLARFDDGSTAEGRLLIGADGLHSTVRRLVDSHAPAPRYTGQLSLGGIVPNSGVEPTPDAYQMIFGRRAFFGYSVKPDGEAYWFANLACPVEPTRESLAATSSDEWKRQLLELFDGDAGPARTLISATDRQLAVYPIHDLPTVPNWHRGRLLLTGDAAHATSPSSGQGAAMAIEDALVLGKCLRDHSEHALAFAAYEQLRRPRVERVVRASARVGNTKVAGPVGRFFRDLMMPAALKLFAGSTAQTWLYQPRLTWD
jgi:2-polyprenyl-6-methoxyphenol hydroxylase-like FAD-dependent oxidoreductase